MSCSVLTFFVEDDPQNEYYDILIILNIRIGGIILYF